MQTVTITKKPDTPNPDVFDVVQLRDRVSRMSDKELRNFGNAARRQGEDLESSDPSRVRFAIEYEEAQLEFKRRHP